ncbi:transposase [Rhizobium altiplani]|uniref:transposase n=1 Tax=Rhizobium altiplani TaxID=1864509 RepID=UPI000400C4F6
MKASQFSDAQRAFILKQVDEGVPGGDLPESGDQPGDLFQLEEKVPGMLPPEMKKLKQLADENARLKKIVADLTLDREMLQDIIRRK